MSNLATSPAVAVGANVRAEMARRRISQTALAEHLGLAQPSVSARLAGRVAFDINELHMVADFLGVPFTLLTEAAA